MAEDSDLERTEEPSLSRLDKAREEGDIPRSKELATCAVLLASASGFAIFGDLLGEAMKKLLSDGLNFDKNMGFVSSLPLEHMTSSIADLLLAFMPFAGLLILVALGSPILIGGWSFNTKSLMPNFTRFNPITGLGNMVSINALVELLKAVGKTVLVGTVAFLVIWNIFPSLLTLSNLSVETGITRTHSLLVSSFFWAISTLVLIALIDIPYQLHRYSQKLRMTKQEVKQEAKESNGNPEVKGRIRQQQREMARRRMMSAIPDADVIITNPTHYAVAIKYSEDSMHAPRVVAKGLDEVAIKIREIAKINGVLILESPKLARALYAHTELRDEIPQQLYRAVAEILAYVFQVRDFAFTDGVYPQVPTDIEVPDEMDPHLNDPAQDHFK